MIDEQKAIFKHNYTNRKAAAEPSATMDQSNSAVELAEHISATQRTQQRVSGDDSVREKEVKLQFLS